MPSWFGGFISWWEFLIISGICRSTGSKGRARRCWFKGKTHTPLSPQDSVILLFMIHYHTTVRFVWICLDFRVHQEFLVEWGLLAHRYSSYSGFSHSAEIYHYRVQLNFFFFRVHLDCPEKEVGSDLADPRWDPLRLYCRLFYSTVPYTVQL